MANNPETQWTPAASLMEWRGNPKLLFRSILVTVSGKPHVDIPPGTLQSMWRQAPPEDESMRYGIVIERGPSSYGASVPDLPGCVAVGETAEEASEF